MKFFSSIKARLMIGSAIVMSLTLVLGLTSINVLTELSTLTQKMYDHPFTVSNAVREVRSDIIQTDFAFVRMINAETDQDVRKNLLELSELKIDIDRNIIIIEERFLGASERVRLTQDKLLAWNSYRSDLIGLLKRRDYEGAEDLYLTDFQRVGHSLRVQVDGLLAYAMNKAIVFLDDSQAQSDKALQKILYFIIFIILAGLLSGIYIALTITRPIEKLLYSLERMSTGSNKGEIKGVNRQDEIGEIARALSVLRTSFQDTIHSANGIASGDFSAKIILRSDQDELGMALLTMSDSLQKSASENTKYAWRVDGQNGLNETIRGERNEKDLAKSIIKFMAEYLGAQIGSLYLLSNDELILQGGYAFTQRKSLNRVIKVGEGLVGQSVIEKNMICLSDIPDEYSQIQSSLGHMTPKNLVVIPFMFEGDVLGVIELGSIHVFSTDVLSLLTILSTDIAIAFNSAKSRREVKGLLQDSQAQSEELEAQQEELKSTNSDIATKSEDLKRQAIMLEISNKEITRKAKEVEEASKYKSEFMSNMSHELRTPLNSLLILAKSLSDNDEGNLTEDDVESATIIHDSGRNLLALINQILDLSKAESGKMEASNDTVLIEELTTGMNSRFKHMAKDKDITFDVSVQSTVSSPFVTDWTKLNQVLTNLISNALKFTATGGVKLSIYTDTASSAINNASRMICFSVTDSGIGVPADKFDTVFEAFKQADGSTTRHYGGTGLGLSIAKNFAELMGGTIQLNSVVGEGSEFILQIPEIRVNVFSEDDLTTDEQPTLKEIVQPLSLVSAYTEPHFKDDRDDIDPTKPLLLLVEDDINFSKILFDLTHEMDCQALVAADGETGLTLANRFNVSAIILDYMLPGLNGEGVLKALKSNKKTKNIPVHIMSAMSNLGDMTLLGAEAQFEKPITPTEVKAVIKSIKKTAAKLNATILIVEDDKAVQFAIKTLFRKEGVALSFTGSISDSLAALKTKNFDVMILDLVLSDGSGFELLEKINADKLLCQPKVFVYSSRDITKEEEIKLEPYSLDIILKSEESGLRLLEEVKHFIKQLKHTTLAKSSELIKMFEPNTLDPVSTDVTKKSEPANKSSLVKNQADADLTNRTILVVDDDMRNTFALSKVLRKSGLNVILAPGGKESIAKLSEHDEIEMVLMDVMMPGMDGYETTREIRKNSQFANLPILALTANAMKGDKEKCLDAGMNDYLSKPVDMDKLYTMIKEWI